MDNARVLVIGAGVNGSACAAGLFAAGIDVTVLARRKRYAEVRDEGILIESPLSNRCLSLEFLLIRNLVYGNAKA